MYKIFRDRAKKMPEQDVRSVPLVIKMDAGMSFVPREFVTTRPVRFLTHFVTEAAGAAVRFPSLAILAFVTSEIYFLGGATTGRRLA